jgi:uncharacterized alkaline shock family protein YloU
VSISSNVEVQQAPPSGGSEHSPVASGPGDPGSRGTTRIADKVVERIASRAVAEIDDATGAPRVVLGQSLGSTTEDTSARVSAQVDGDLVTVDVAMAVRWPAPILDVTRQVRERVATRVSELCGLSVLEVDIDVATLLTDEPRAPRVR